MAMIWTAIQTVVRSYSAAKVIEKDLLISSKSYMKMVDNSYLGSSDELMKLIQRVEATFIKHFANGNRRKGMNILRPQMKRERHRLTFSTGFSAGCVYSLIVALVAIIRTRKIFQKESHKDYMISMFPLYR